MKLFTVCSLFTALGLAAAQAPMPPKMELLYSMDCLLGPSHSLGSVPEGRERRVIPIIGGNFTGPRMSGKILNLGADWLLVDSQGISRPDTRYGLQTHDGTYIYVQTNGPAVDGKIMLKGKFETDAAGKYGWLNSVVAVGVLTSGNGSVHIDMWDVKPQL